MKKSKYIEKQIVFGLKQAELGIPVLKVYRKMGISEATFYNCKKKTCHSDEQIASNKVN